MNTQVQESIQQIINAFNNHLIAVQEYNMAAYGGVSTWEEQRKIYDHWIKVDSANLTYLVKVDELMMSLTQEVNIPVIHNTYVGIGLLNVGVIYVCAPSRDIRYPFEPRIVSDFNQSEIMVLGDDPDLAEGLIMNVGGLPDGTYIYTQKATYVIQQGQPINLTV